MQVEYIPRAELKQAGYFGEASQTRNSTKFGAFRLTLNNNKKDGKTVIIQRSKGVYMGEVMFHKIKNQRYYFSAGINTRRQATEVSFRIEF